MTAADKVSALSFDGVDDYVDCGNDASLNITGPGSIEVWIMVLAWGDRYDAILWKKGGAWADIHYGILRASADTRFLGTISDGTNYLNGSGPGTSSIELNKWYHLVFTWDGVTAKMYTNGVQTSSGSTTILPMDELDNIKLSANYPFNGLIDEVRIYNRALSADEVLYNKEHPHAPILNGLVLWLSGESLDYANGIWRDASGNGNNGTLYGPTELKMNRLAGRILAS